MFSRLKQGAIRLERLEAPKQSEPTQKGFKYKHRYPEGEKVARNMDWYTEMYPLKGLRDTCDRSGSGWWPGIQG